jgi:hypothetical protein
MRIRYISTDRRRVRVLTNDVEQLLHIHRKLVTEGFRQVGLVRFLIHLATAGRRGYGEREKKDGVHDA